MESSEEMAYVYDDMGRLQESTFAETPQAGQTGYDTFDPETRAHVYYDYDQAGRVQDVEYWWDTFNHTDPLGPEYYASPIWKTTATYNHKLGLKDSTTYWNAQPATNDFGVDHTETYTYDPQTDWLTGVNYNDGNPNAIQSWTYDVAGNRISDSAKPGTWTYDNLNRMTASPMGTYGNDILGNRNGFTSTAGTGSSYGWDDLNRMIQYTPDLALTSGNKYTYQYRADGQRTKKTDGWINPTNPTVTQYFYDGQMGVQDTITSGANTTVKRGKAFPLYDTHGNMVATLARSGLGSYTTANWQSYDVWGSVRSGNSSMNQGYVARIGHRSDAESGLLYMRARYYEPSSGRFVSEDPATEGQNWYAYANNSPSMYSDSSGKDVDWKMNPVLKQFGYLLMAMAAYVTAVAVAFGGFKPVAKLMAYTSLAFFTSFYGFFRSSTIRAGGDSQGFGAYIWLALGGGIWLAASYFVALASLEGLLSSYAPGSDALGALAIYAATLFLFMTIEDFLGEIEKRPS